MKYLKKSIIITLVALLFAGCGTSVSFQAERAPKMNTAGMKRLAIMPFETGNNTSLQKTTAQYITSTVISRVRSANYFTLVDPGEVDRLQKAGERLENHVDGLFTGQIISLRTNDASRKEERYNPKTEQTYEVTIYERTAEIAFNYRLIRTRDGNIIDVVTKQGKRQDQNEEKSRLKSASQLVEEIIAGELSKLAQDVAPYMVTVRRSLMDENSKDKELKNRMKDIASAVKTGDYRTSCDLYLTVYSQYNNTAAYYNAAVMYEVQGDLTNAVRIVENLYSQTGNPQARTYLNSLNASIQEQEKLIAGFSDSANQTNKVISLAVDEISRVIPRNAKLWIFNNSKDDLTFADIIINGITSALLQKGITVVDRENASLIEAEQMLQMSGVVSDNDFVSIGNAAGANTLVTVSVSGVSNLRRLQLRVLDIETRRNLYQSDASDNWKL